MGSYVDEGLDRSFTFSYTHVGVSLSFVFCVGFISWSWFGLMVELLAYTRMLLLICFFVLIGLV